MDFDSDSDIGENIVVKHTRTRRKSQSTTAMAERKFGSDATIKDSDSEGEGAGVLVSAGTLLATPTVAQNGGTSAAVHANSSGQNSNTATAAETSNTATSRLTTSASMVVDTAYTPATSNPSVGDGESDSESSLSTRSATPPPPTIQQPVPAVTKRRVVEVECTHLDWCDCPMHAGYDRGVRIWHLGEWALANQHIPESAIRSTIARERVWKHASTCKTVVELLVQMQGVQAGFAAEQAARGRARVFVRLVDIHFPVERVLPGEEGQMEMLLRAFEGLKESRDWGRLVERVRCAVKGHVILIREFRELLPGDMQG